MELSDFLAHREMHLFMRSGICAWMEAQASSQAPDVNTWRNVISAKECDDALHTLWCEARAHLGACGDRIEWRRVVEDPDLQVVLGFASLGGGREIVCVTDGARTFHAVLMRPPSTGFFLIPSDDFDLHPNPEDDTVVSLIPMWRGRNPKDETLMYIVPYMLLKAWEKGNLEARDTLVGLYRPCIENLIQRLSTEFDAPPF